MRQFKDFLVKENTVIEDDGVLLPEGFVYDEEPLLESVTIKHHEMPAVLVLRRTSFRQFPNGQIIALYHADKINKYITIPYEDETLPSVSPTHNK
jgi:hypothetical protein